MLRFLPFSTLPSRAASSSPERSTRGIFWLVVLLGFWTLSGPLQAQRKEKVPPNDPSQCPYCENDPELLKAAGLVSHGGFEFGRKTTAEVNSAMGGLEIYWLETPHFEIGFALPTVKVRQDEKDKIRAECEQLRLALPEVPDKPKLLDPWLRLHLYGQRLEELYAQMVTLFDVGDVTFPEPGTVWDMTGEYWGEGPYLGQKGKFEILLLPSEGWHERWLRGEFGLRTKKSQRWHVIDTGSLHLVVHTEQGSLKVDEALHGHVVFNVSIMCTNALKHYNYDMPVWLLEGIGHYMERRLNPKYNTFDGGEGGTAQVSKKENWEPEVKRLVAKDRAPGLTVLTRMTNFAELDLDRHFACWSIIDYLERAHPGTLSKLIRRCSDLRNEEHIPDGSALLDEQRAVFKDELKMSYLQFDRAWAEWVLETYSSK